MRDAKKLFAVVRILGNELPPRDRPGRRAEVLRFQLEKEPVPDDAVRFWILNRIHEPAFREELIATLKAAGERWYEIPFDGAAYAAAGDRRARLLYAIHVNGARNYALGLARKEARFSLVLDGDCWLGPAEWKLVRDGLAADQAAHPDRAYYSFPMIRATFEEALSGDLRHRLLEEPQLAFRDDAALSFDESLAFGEKDKVELLERLGHEPYRPGVAVEHALAADAPCASVGRVIHLQTGEDAAEDSRIERGRLRELSVRRLLKKLDERHPPAKGFFSEKQPEPPDAELEAARWRADFRAFDAGDGLWLVYGAEGKPHLVPAALRYALDGCKRFRILPDHARWCVKTWRRGDKARLKEALGRWREGLGLPAGPQALEADLLDALERLAADGLFASASGVLALCRKRQTPPRVALEAVVKPAADGTTGAARNALMLEAGRSLLLMRDADAVLPEGEEAPLTRHERWLGRSLGPDVFVLETMNAESLRRLRAGRSRLRATFRACLPMRLDGRPARDRAERERRFKKALGRDYDVQGLAGVTLTDGLDLECGELGLDLRDGLVPFPEGLAGEDAAFAAALAVVYESDFAARLPGTIRRPLAAVRRFSCDRTAKAGPTAAELLALLIQAAAPPRAVDEPAARRAALAEGLAELAGLSERAFAGFCARALRRQSAELAAALDAARREPMAWPGELKREELRQERDRLALEARRPDIHVPVDAPSFQGVAAAYAALLSGWAARMEEKTAAREAVS